MGRVLPHVTLRGSLCHCRAASRCITRLRACWATTFQFSSHNSRTGARYYTPAIRSARMYSLTRRCTMARQAIPLLFKLWSPCVWYPVPPKTSKLAPSKEEAPDAPVATCR
ncbi:hypothetical protein TRVL_06720 [Trypanosoma vivax]|nr:hypothetical protein TRVL_06720 [Trypanosoma vivax]